MGACCAGRQLVRINLSEQTDMMDLLGADLPAAGGAAGQFAWADGPLLAALQAGAWVLLDELNLASARPARFSVRVSILLRLSGPLLAAQTEKLLFAAHLYSYNAAAMTRAP